MSRWILLLSPVAVVAACGGRSDLFVSEGSIREEAGPSDGGGGVGDVTLPDVVDGAPEAGVDAQAEADADAVEETADACASGCTSPEVVGGTYDRSYDGFTYTDRTNPATVSTFRLDRYEVTVGRFRPFVVAVLGGWLPAGGAGKHTHLNGGQGLAATGGGYETGWDATDWNGQFPTTASAWNDNLASGTWTATPGSNEDLPITQLDWYEAYAFCIWDGGFLPSEAEWNYAAAGGSDQRAYPWSPAFPPGSTSIDCTQANYDGCPMGVVAAVGSRSPEGDGKWGQSDVAGNVWEWNLDWEESSYVTPCVDCANLTAASFRVLRGGSFGNSVGGLLASYRSNDPPYYRGDLVGVRCARAP
jgi:formylglycine-generating enzyme required for sulfatase activity